MGANLLTGLCTGRCWKSDQREASRSLVWYWSSAGLSVWLVLDVVGFVGFVAGLQAGRAQGQETGTVCKG